jgi:hypothetical protein
MPLTVVIDYLKDDVEEADVFTPNVNSQNIHLAIALQHASKTYVEKRSWLHPLLTLRRLIEWEIIKTTQII